MPASGATGILINVLGEWIFCVDDQEDEFCEYRLLHGDLKIKIDKDEMASFYIDETGEESLLDYSPNVMGFTLEGGLKLGMFDELICEYDLPVEGVEGEVYQTKSTPNRALDRFKIGKDKQLYEELYDVVDRSDPNAEGIERLKGMASRTNKRFVKSSYTGEIRFYTSIEKENDQQWYEFSSYFIDGMLKYLIQIEADR
jgi:hypothetical protein